MSLDAKPAMSQEGLTPMMRQYFELKHKAGDAILFFRMGDFFEIFGTDAELVAPILELVLTSREKGDQERIPFCGVPHHSARNYWLRLLRKGYKVALADQIEDPAEAKGLVRRDIVRTLTPGCLDDPEGLERDAPNYVMAVHEVPGTSKWAVALADLSTGELRLGQEERLEGVKSRVDQFRPKEILARRFFHRDLGELLGDYRTEHGLLIEPLPEGPLRDEAEQRSILTTVFGSPDLTSHGSGSIPGGPALIAALMAHFRSLQVSLAAFVGIRPLLEPDVMSLDETAVRDLELFETVRRRKAEGSLLREINQTLSPMGARLLRLSLSSPLVSIASIQKRHEAVRTLTRLGEAQLEELRHELKNFPDVERLGTRVVAGSASPADLERLTLGLQKALWLSQKLSHHPTGDLSSGLYADILQGLQHASAPLRLLEEALETNPRALGTGVGVFRPAYDATLDELGRLAQSGETQVEAYQETLRRQTGIGSLKIKQHKSYGLLIEVTKTHSSKVPSGFIKRQTMVNCDRYSTATLQELDEALANAQERAMAREAELYTRLLRELAPLHEGLREVSASFALFDLLQGFAWQALRYGYCEPEVNGGDEMVLRGSRHPVVERYVGRHQFVPNDIIFEPTKRHLLITGPNMAGKSTVMRQVALTAILCQIGSFVPALEARLPIFDRIFTRVGAADDLSRGHSTFMVEMSEAANILRHATSRSLVILDEVGRGTSTVDGLALASAILEDLATRLQSFSLFATHYHEMVPFAAGLPSVRLMQTEVLETAGKILFTHRLIEGASDSSYGLEVARLAGIPGSVLERAKTLVRGGSQGVPVLPPETSPSPRSRESETTSTPPAVPPLAPPPLERLGLAPGSSSARDDGATQLRDRVAKLSLNRMTPLQALNFLSEMQLLLTERKQGNLFQEEGC